MWREAQRRIPSALALVDRGIQAESSMCSSCIDNLERANHLLINCPFAISVRGKIFNWCGINVFNIHNVGELMQLGISWGRCPKKREKF